MSIVLGFSPTMLDVLSLSWLFSTGFSLLVPSWMEYQTSTPFMFAHVSWPRCGLQPLLKYWKKSQTFDRKIDIESIMSVWKLVRVCRPGMTYPGVSFSAYPHPRVIWHVPFMIFGSPRAPSCLTNHRWSSDSEEDTGNLAVWSRKCICWSRDTAS